MRTPHALAWLVAISLPIGLLGCSDPEEKKDAPPEIRAFDASAELVERGGTVVLNWETAHATSLTLTAGDAPVDLGDASIASGEVEVTMEEATTFTLTASGKGPSAVRSVTVNVSAGPPPAIVTFAADPAEVSKGEHATLSWKTERAVSIALEADPGGAVDVSGLDAEKGSLRIEPSVSTTYRLSATSKYGDEVHESVTVTVRPAPAVTFVAQPATIVFGESSVLSWSASNATHVKISSPDAVLYDGEDAAGEVEVSPSAKTTYTLDATGPGGAASATADVSVAPAIDEFTTSAAGLVRVGMEVELAWKTRGARALTLSNGAGFETEIVDDFMAEGALRAPVGAGGVFTLRAVNGDEVTTSEVRLQLTDLPLVAEFSIDRDAVTADPDHPASVEIAWTVIGADSLRLAIDPPGSDEVLGRHAGTMRVSVVETTTFRLTAVNDAGTVERDLQVQVGGAPAIAAFAALPSRVGSGEVTTISWDAVNAAAIRLEQDGVDVGVDPTAYRGTYDAHLAADSTFLLFVANVAGEAVTSRPLPVTVGAPIVGRFQANPDAAIPGSDLELSWFSDGGTSLAITTAAGGVLCESSDPATIREGSCVAAMPVTADDVVLTLTVTNGDGADHRDVTITNTGGPRVASFTVSPGVIEAGQQLRFRWEVENDVAGDIPTITLGDDKGNTYDVSLVHPNHGQTSITIPAPGSYAFTLTATTAGTKPARATATAVVQIIPQILSLTASPDTVAEEGDPATVEWTTQDALHLRLFQVEEGGTIRGTGPVFATSVQSEMDHAATLVAPTLEAPNFLLELENAAGTIVRQTLRVGVNRADVLSFTATPRQVLRGETSTLEWTTANATKASLRTSEKWVEIDEPFIDLTGMPGAQPFDLGTVQSAGCKKLDLPGGFVFPFDGAPRTFVLVCHPGFLGFDPVITNSTSNNQPLPNPSYKYANLAPFWDDLVFTSQGGQILTGLVGSGADRAFVVQYKNYSLKSDLDGRLNFEVVLREDGSFDFRYGDMVSVADQEIADGKSATIGWQNALFSDATVISHNAVVPGGLGHRTFHFPILPLDLAPHEIAGAYVDLEGAEDAQPLTLNSTGQTGYVNLDFPEGFVFRFAGADRTSVWVHASGYLGFKTGTSSSGRPTNKNLLVGPGALGTGDAQYVQIAPYWQYLTNSNQNNGGAGGKLFHALRSDAEGQYLVVQWKGYSGQSAADSDLSFEVFLREDGSFEYHYGPMTSPTNPAIADGSLATIGFQDPNGFRGFEHSFKTAIPGLSGSGLRFTQVPEIPVNGQLVVKPMGTVEYLLEASNAGSRHEVGAVVAVETPAQIHARVSPAYPAPMEAVSIEWTGRGAAALRISDANGRVLYWALPEELEAGRGSLSIPAGLPRGEHTYELWAVGNAGDVAEFTLTFMVEDPFSLDDFAAMPARIKLGEAATLSWATTNPTNVTLTLLDGTPVSTTPLAASGMIAVEPEVTTTYRLVVESHGRSEAREVTVEVRTAWVDQVDLSPEAPAGGSANLAWNTTGGNVYLRQPAALVEDVSAANPYVDISTMGAAPINLTSTTTFVNVGLPFNFPDPTGGTPKNTIRVNARGIVTWSTSDSPSSKVQFPSGTTTDRARMGIFWDTSNLQIAGAAGTTPASFSSLHVEDPSGPDAFIVQWKDVKLGSSTTARGSLNFQLVLWEDGTFEYRYGDMIPGDDIRPATATSIAQAQGSIASIGFQRYRAGVGYQLSYNTVFPGGVEHRSFRFPPTFPASGQANVVITDTTEFEICVDDADWSECTVKRVVVPKPGDLMITEIQAMPIGGPDAQWFEVRNLSPDPMDLHGKVIRSGSQSVTISAPGGVAILPTGGYATLARSTNVPFVPDAIFGPDIDFETSPEIFFDFGATTLASARWDSSWFQTAGYSRSLDPSRQIRWVAENPNVADWCLDSDHPIAGADFGTPGAHGSTCKQPYYEVDYLADLPFIDISMSGTRVPGIATSFGYEAIPGGLGFDFQFFGNSIPDGQEIWAAMNGTVAFGYYGANIGTKLGSTAPVLPHSLVGVNHPGIVVGSWDELRAQTGTHFEFERTTIDGRRVAIFQWTNYGFNQQTGSITLQIQLWEDGDIVIGYADLTGTSPRFQGSTSTVGLENVGGSEAIQGFYKQPVLFPGQAVLFRLK